MYNVEAVVGLVRFGLEVQLSETLPDAPEVEGILVVLVSWRFFSMLQVIDANKITETPSEKKNGFSDSK